MEEFLERVSVEIHQLLINNDYSIPLETIKYTLLIIFTTPFIATIYKCGKYVNEVRQKFKAQKDLHPLIDGKEIDEATKYYVPTKGQNISPTNDAEPRSGHAFTTKETLIPFYLNAIKDPKNTVKHYLILADSGMGKSTFLINLYLSYNRTLFKRKYKMVLVPLGHPEADNIIENIANQENSILLLDGLDEDPKAGKDYEERIKFLTKKTFRFRRIFLTSRTQFFPSENKEPFETALYKHSLDNDRQHYFKKIYISPFDDSDVDKYIRKKFPLFKFWNLGKRRKAYRIIALSPNLMVRPMLLSYIETIVDNEENDEFLRKNKKTYLLTAADVYELLIHRWILREAKRTDIIRRNDFIENMYKFSEELSLYIFNHKLNTLTVSSDEIVSLAQKNNINLSEIELKGKSLLNRDASGNFKFAHKSIFEYFLAKIAVSNRAFGQGTLYFNDMDQFDQASKFCTELMMEQEVI